MDVGVFGVEKIGDLEDLCHTLNLICLLLSIPLTYLIHLYPSPQIRR